MAIKQADVCAWVRCRWRGKSPSSASDKTSICFEWL